MKVQIYDACQVMHPRIRELSDLTAWICTIAQAANDSGEPLEDAAAAEVHTWEEATRRSERKESKRNLGWDDFAWGLLSGWMSALSRVIGSEWKESLDT